MTITELENYISTYKTLTKKLNKTEIFYEKLVNSLSVSLECFDNGYERIEFRDEHKEQIQLAVKSIIDSINDEITSMDSEINSWKKSDVEVKNNENYSKNFN